MNRLEALKAYLKSCLADFGENADWHGARDAIVDIEVEIALERGRREGAASVPPVFRGEGLVDCIAPIASPLGKVGRPVEQPRRPISRDAGADGIHQEIGDGIPRNSGQFPSGNESTGRSDADTRYFFGYALGARGKN